MEKKRIAVFGCTGSIGENTLEIVRRHRKRFEVVGLAAGRNAARLKELAREFSVSDLALAEPRDDLPGGDEVLAEMASREDVDIVVNAVVGAAGLSVTLAAVRSGKTLALANKESLVTAGELVMRLAREKGATIRPIDSEHSALEACLCGRDRSRIRRVILTASGGPFRGRKAGSFDDVTVAEALNHPTWSMGPKITIDSATLMNKALEVIEAHHLFGFSPDEIAVVVHPQSIIHAMVENRDGTVIVELAPPDMRIPIQRALMKDGDFSAPLDLERLKDLTFEPVDREAFPMLDLAYRCLEKGGTAGAVVNAANEVAVQAFLEERISFGAIPRIVTEVLERHEVKEESDEGVIREADEWARVTAERFVRKKDIGKERSI
ncbi:MAG: 1-deoxy-D-xylulose-5-phosphate reductoisomerase [Candidatus Hydrogenedentota bacterium]|nr:MAG: 1-deoxy-D-xylulose-5-phosphate reductoisomerase [Candidatus Hydrogenedentota bacterium]